MATDSEAESQIETVEISGSSDDCRSVEITPLSAAWGGIVLAAGCYPCIIALIAIGTTLLTTGPSVFHEPVKTLGWLIYVPIVLSVLIGCVFAIVAVIPAYILLQLARLSTDMILTERGSCGVFGALTACLCISPVMVADLAIARMGTSIDLLAVLLFFVLPIGLGHLGGVYGCFRRRQERTWFHDPFFDRDKRITLRLLLGGTLVVALLVAACKAAGELGIQVAFLVACYGAVQGILLFAEHLWRQRVSGLKDDEAKVEP